MSMSWDAAQALVARNSKIKAVVMEGSDAPLNAKTCSVTPFATVKDAKLYLAERVTCLAEQGYKRTFGTQALGVYRFTRDDEVAYLALDKRRKGV